MNETAESTGGRAGGFLGWSWTPGRGLVRLVLAWTALSAVAVAWPAARGAWRIGGGLVILAVLFALWELRRRPKLVVQRQALPNWPLGEWTEVHLDLSIDPAARRRARPIGVDLFDHYPVSAELEGLPQTVEIARTPSVESATPGTTSETLRVTYRLRPRRRGEVRFAEVEVWHRSTFDLLRRRHAFGSSEIVRVLPNFRPILLQGLAGLEENMARQGVHLQRRRGEGLEFQELRDFRPGDTLRQVDWKATARRGQLISRQYQDERNQQVVLMLDCGRRLHAREGDLTHFDHVLDASLLLSWVAARQGDAVGFQAFAGDRRWLPPTRGAFAVERVVDALYDLQTSLESPDYQAAAARLLERQRRRALVLLITNLRDEDEDDLLPMLHLLRRRHLVLVASLRERALGAMRDQPVRGFDAALAGAAAPHYVAARRRTHDAVRAGWAFVLAVEPQVLPWSLVARYLDIKRAGLL
ncbi:MAG: DUF58 domain-containing protein [Acidobacteriota bacterium]